MRRTPSCLSWFRPIMGGRCKTASVPADGNGVLICTWSSPFLRNQPRSPYTAGAEALLLLGHASCALGWGTQPGLDPGIQVCSPIADQLLAGFEMTRSFAV